MRRQQQGIPLVRLWRRSFGVLVSGVKEDRDFRALAVLVLSLLLSGSLFYMIVGTGASSTPSTSRRSC